MTMFDLSWITDMLAIGGRFSPQQTAALASDQHVSAVIDLRGEESDDAQLLAKHDIAFLHLPTIDFAPVHPDALSRGTAFARDQLAVGRRVFVHCARGIGRSVVLGLCVLVEQGHAPLAALTLAKARRSCVAPSPNQYEAWAVWLQARLAERGADWRVPTLQEFKAIAYR